ncbi:hypothetical protein J8C06_12940 [Chloracidobacterium validum]|uniref:Uncharacterized protein n=1 Tax=Chloracidobacterium validum TaxID=2821543 RepID=A0ABX8BFP0_9BACT|nr:hypothetical protein J8C06_12940 [Chloracidobacterium validum]
MGLDIRIPIGAMFVSMGLILAGYGWLTNGIPGFYDKSLGININLWWGLAMTLFGGALLVPRWTKSP